MFDGHLTHTEIQDSLHDRGETAQDAAVITRRNHLLDCAICRQKRDAARQQRRMKPFNRPGRGPHTIAIP